MSTALIRYRVKPGRAEENAGLVRAVYAELADVRPEGFRYATFKLPDGVSFVHFALYDDADVNPLADLAAFREFSSGIRERCEEPPAVSELEAVGTYRL